MNYRILFFTDIHVYPHRGHSKTLDDGTTTSLQECKRSMSWVASLVDELNPDVTINGGDTIHTQGFVDSLSVQAVYDGAEEIKAACNRTGSDLKWIIGNHDMYRDSTSAAIHTLPFLPGKVESITVDNRILFIPYTERYDDVYDAFSSHTGDIAFTHLDYVGAKLNSSASSIKGIDPTSLPFVTVNGHYHHPHVIGSLINAGSLMYHSFQDVLEPIRRGCLYITVSDSTIEVSKNTNVIRNNNGSYVYYRWIPNPHTSIYHTIKPSSLDELKREISKLTDVSERTNLRICAKTPDIAKCEPPKGFSNVRIDDQTPKEIIRNSNVDHTSAAEDVIDTWMKEHPIPSGLRFEDVVSEGRSILSKVSSESSRIDISVDNWKIRDFMPIESAVISVRDGVSLVEGLNKDAATAPSNGSGKSSIFEALLWCLYGKLMRDGMTATDVIRRGAKTSCVSVDISKSGTKYRIVRTQKKNGSSIEVFCGDSFESIAPRNSGPAQKYVISLLGIDYDEFVHMVYLGGTGFQFTKLSDSSRKDLIEGVIGSSIYSDAMLEAKSRSKEIYTSMSDINNKIIVERAAVVSANNLLETMISKRDSSFKRNSSVIDEIKKDVTVLQNNNTVLSSDIESINNHLLEVKKEILLISNDIDDLTLKRSKVSDKLSETKIELGSGVEAVKSLSWVGDGLCPTCGSNSTISHSDKLHIMEENVIKVKSKINSLESMLKSLNEKILTLEETKRLNYYTCNNEQRNLGILEEKIRANNRVIDEKNKLTLSVNNELEKFDEMIDNLSVDIKTSEKKLHTLSNKLSSFNSMISIVDYWIIALSPTGIRSLVLDRAIGLINDRLMRYSYSLTSGEMGVSLSSTRFTKGGDERSEISIDVHGLSESYGESSAGQRKRIDLCIQFSLYDLLQSFRGNVNLLIVDEIDSGLDIVEPLVITLTNMNRCVFLVTHRPDLKAVLGGQTVGQTISVVRKDGSSSVSVR